MQKLSGRASWCWVFSIAVFLCLSCNSDPRVVESKSLFQKFIEFSRSGDERAVCALYAPESQPFVRLTPEQADRMRRTSFDLIKTVPHDNYVELQVLIEAERKQYAGFFHMVTTDSGLRLQFPFVLLAQNWPTVQSRHFVVHSRAMQVKSLMDDSLCGESPDTTFLESFLQQLTGLTGWEPETPIHYYHCADTREAGELIGVKDQAVAHIGPCVISWRPLDLQQITYAAMIDAPQPIDILALGIGFWGELKVPFPNEQYRENSLRLIGKYVAQLDTIPLSQLVRFYRLDTSQSKTVANMASVVGGVVIQKLMERNGEEQFCALYQASTDPAAFETALTNLYGLRVAEIEQELIAEYQAYRPVTPPAQSSAGDSGEFAYEHLAIHPTDLNSDLLNTHVIKTAHCQLQCSNDYTLEIASIAATVEQEYERVAADFSFDRTTAKPLIIVLPHQQYVQFSDDLAGGYLREIGRDSLSIVIEESRFRIGTPRFAQVVSHELTHYVIRWLNGGRKTHGGGMAVKCFEEAICQFEDGRDNLSKSEWVSLFKETPYQTLAEIDTATTPDIMRMAIAEFRLLVDLMVERNGYKILAELAPSLQSAPLEETLSRATGVPFDTLQQEWFRRMRQRYSGT